MAGQEPFLMIATRDLTKSYDQRRAVDAVTLDVRQGEIFGLIGPNGAGKSTLIKMLTTLLPPTSGNATVVGYDLGHQARLIRQRIGYVPQLLSADGGLTGYENLLLSARLYLIPRAERAARIAAALAMTGLTEMANRRAQTYSGGMLRRLEIAQSTLHRPVLLIMDEPTVGLDPVARQAIWNHIRDLRTRLGTTMLITSHVMEEVDLLCDRVGILHRGKLEKVGSPAELKAEIGPEATLNDVFTRIAGADIEMGGEHGNAREARRSAIGHL